MIKVCSVDGCNKKPRAKGFCANHYAKWHRYGNPLHIANPEETRKKISEANRGKKRSQETRKKISEANRGKKRSQETRKKISESNRGRKNSQETRKKISEANRGKKRSQETRKKISESGKSRKHSRITKRKISESNKGKNKGKKPSKSTKEKIRKANTGKTHNKKTKKKQSELKKGKKNPMYGKTSPNKGKKTSEEIKEKIRKTLTGFEHTEETRKKMSELMSTPERKELSRVSLRKARHNQIKPNNQELKIKKILIDAGMDYDIHFDMLVNIQLNTTLIEQNSKEVDFLILPNKIIEFNGTYSHADPRKYKPDDKIWSKIAKNIWKTEKIVLEQLRKQGYEILVVWELDLKKDLEKITKRILKFAKA
jgi:hypothetical protein